MISSLLIKPAGADCNMACSYCFYRRAAGLYPDTPQPRMPAEVLRELVRQYMELSRRGPGVLSPDCPSCTSSAGGSPARAGEPPALLETQASPEQDATAAVQAAFCWQGGEPTLMGLDFFRQVVALQQKFGCAGQIVGNSLQTNGLLINEEWARFLARYRFLIGLSLDGPPEVHDYYRLGMGGQGTQRQVVRAWHVLQRHGVDTNTLSMATSYSADKAPLVFESLYELGARFMQFIPCLEAHPRTHELLPYTISAEQYGDFLCDLFEVWRPYSREVSIRLFDDVLARLMGHAELVSCEFRPRCGEYLVVEHNGDLYSCDFFVDDGHRLGNLLTRPIAEAAAGAEFEHFAAAKSEFGDTCRECQWLTTCQGGCPRHRQFGLETGLCQLSGSGLATPLCESYRRFFGHALPALEAMAKERLAEIAAEDVAPQEPGSQ